MRNKSFLQRTLKQVDLCREKKINFNPYLTAYAKINSKRITDLSIRAETTKLLE